jgi:hypothetical protein
LIECWEIRVTNCLSRLERAQHESEGIWRDCEY